MATTLATLMFGYFNDERHAVVMNSHEQTKTPCTTSSEYENPPAAVYCTQNLRRTETIERARAAQGELCAETCQDDPGVLLLQFGELRGWLLQDDVGGLERDVVLQAFRETLLHGPPIQVLYYRPGRPLQESTQCPDPFL